MDVQATDGPSPGQVPADGESGERCQNIVWGTAADAAQRPVAAPGVSAPAPATLSQDGQLLESGYGHGV